MLIKQQTSGADGEWPEFLLHTIPGLRKSDRVFTIKAKMCNIFYSKSEELFNRTILCHI